MRYYFMKNNKVYKWNIFNNFNMIPGDPKGSPDESFFLDWGFKWIL